MKWNFNKENWFKNAKWLSYGDLRLTAGQNIYPNGSLIDIYGEYNPTGFYNNAPRVGINTGRIPNPYLKAKNVIQYNFGFDVGRFDGKLDVIFDTYYKKVDNELFTNVLSNTLGFDTYQSNGAAIANYGYELSFTSRPLSKESKLQWTISLNGAWNQDVLLRIPSEYNGQYINTVNQDGISQFIALRTGRNSLSNYLYTNQGVYGSTTDVPVDPVTGLRIRNLARIGDANITNYLTSY